MKLKLEFHSVKDPMNPTAIAWRLTNEHGKVLATSTERWANMEAAKERTGEVFVELMRNDFEVFDLTTETKPRKRKA